MQLFSFNSYVDPKSIMVINKQGHIRKLYCPFRVLCIEATGEIPINTWCYVNEVHPNSQMLIVYDINGNQFPYRCFQIFITF